MDGETTEKEQMERLISASSSHSVAAHISSRLPPPPPPFICHTSLSPSACGGWQAGATAQDQTEDAAMLRVRRTGGGGWVGRVCVLMGGGGALCDFRMGLPGQQHSTAIPPVDYILNPSFD